MRRVLIIQFKMLGDVLTSTVLADVLKSEMSDVQIDYLISKAAEPVVSNHPNIDELVMAKDNDMKVGSGLFAFAKAMRKKKYDIVIDAYGKINSGLITRLSGAPQRIGYNKGYLSMAYTDRVKQSADKELFKSGEAIGSRLNLLQPLNIKISPEVRPSIHLTEEEETAAFKFLWSEEINTLMPIAVVAILGSSPEKSLPDDYMAAILDLLAKEEFQIILNYSPDQEASALRIVEMCNPDTPNQIYFDAYPRSLREFVAILPHTNCLIGNEGGAVNMAKAVGTPTFAIFSPWIRKGVWNIDGKGVQHKSVHLQDYLPEVYGDQPPARFKNRSMELYNLLKPELFFKELQDFLKAVR